MEGPKPLDASERDSLAELVDAIFANGQEGAMFRAFSEYFSEKNDGNHFVFVDEGRVISHVGMDVRWATITGCAVRVGCIGAVGTNEAYRGQGLATRLLEA